MGIFTRIANRMDRQSGLMHAMMQRMDVDMDSMAASGSGRSLEAAVRSCLACHNSDECQHWLEGSDGSEPDFCPNAPYFAMHHK